MIENVCFVFMIQVRRSITPTPIPVCVDTCVIHSVDVFLTYSVFHFAGSWYGVLMLIDQEVVDFSVENSEIVGDCVCKCQILFSS